MSDGTPVEIPHDPVRSAMLARFVGAIFMPDDVVEIRAFWPDREAKKYPFSRWVRAADLPHDQALLAELKSSNDAGWGIYFGVNARKAHGGRNAESVAQARTLFVDFDHASLDTARLEISRAGLPEPTVLVSSGHGVHAYFLLDQPLTNLDLWRSYQKALIAKLPSADRAIHDPPRVLRLPTFSNTKSPAAPCVLIEANPERAYPLAAFPVPSPRVIVRAATVLRKSSWKQGSGGSPYGSVALEREAKIVAETPEGGRRTALLRGAFRMGRLIAGGELIQAEAHAALRSAAEQAGLEEPEITETIDSGMAGGKQFPRQRPADTLGDGGWRWFITAEMLAQHGVSPLTNQPTQSTSQITATAPEIHHVAAPLAGGLVRVTVQKWRAKK